MVKETLRVLLIEDSLADVGLVRVTLDNAADKSTFAVDLSVAGSISEAATLVRQSDPDVILLDLGLPDKVGMAAFRAAINLAPETPIIVLSGNKDEDIAIAALKDGAVDYLPKDELTPTLLTRAIRYGIARKEADLVAMRALLEAERANEAKSEFLSSMSHEIRTPLNGVLGMADMLLRSQLTREQAVQLETIREAGNLLLALLNDILDISKIEAGKLELESLDFSLDQLIESVDRLWVSKAEAEGLEFSVSQSPLPAPILMSDPNRIRQILYNLLSNAIKFTSAGSVKLEVSQTELADGRISTRFDVRDTGEGISRENADDLFAKFVQVDSSIARRYGGSGLGLAISKELVTILGGEIDFESAPGEGSHFWFTVVCGKGRAETIVDQSAQNAQEDGNPKLRILVAEDNRINQAVIGALLGATGHEVEIVGSGTEAVEALRHAQYNVVLMDIQMPDMDGMSATRLIRDLPAPANSVPVVALTANAMIGDRERYLAAGMDDYVSKPIDPVELTAALQRQCGAVPA